MGPKVLAGEPELAKPEVRAFISTEPPNDFKALTANFKPCSVFFLENLHNPGVVIEPGTKAQTCLTKLQTVS
jgi:hypothetical protein